MGDWADDADNFDDYLNDGFVQATLGYIPSRRQSVKKESYRNHIKNNQNTSFDYLDKYSEDHAERLQFCIERDKIHKERERNFQKDKIEALKTMTKSQVFVACKRCKGGFVAKIADRKRGWGKFCSKSCKAQHQERN